MKIAFVGSHGTGKSTAVFEKATELKIQYPSKDIGIFVENARKSPFPINKNTSVLSQLWIFTNQIQEEIVLGQQHDILVCDRSIFDAIAYTFWINEELASAMVELGKYYAYTYDKVYFKTIKNNDYLVYDGIRESSDIEYRQYIEDKLVEILKTVELKYEML